MLPMRSQLRFIIIREDIALQVAEIHFAGFDAAHPAAGDHFVVDESGPDGATCREGQLKKKWAGVVEERLLTLSWDLLGLRLGGGRRRSGCLRGL